MALELIVNGQTRTFDQLQPGASVADLVGALGLKSDRIAIERNGEIVSRANWSNVTLMSGDKLEMVHFVGGGSASMLLNWASMPGSTECRLAARQIDGDAAVEGEMVLR